MRCTLLLVVGLSNVACAASAPSLGRARPAPSAELRARAEQARAVLRELRDDGGLEQLRSGRCEPLGERELASAVRQQPPPPPMEDDIISELIEPPAERRPRSPECLEAATRFETVLHRAKKQLLLCMAE